MLSVLIATRAAVKIFYLQETAIVSDSLVYPSAKMATLDSSFTSSAHYTWSTWIYKTAWSDEYDAYFRISLDTASFIHPTLDRIFTTSTTENINEVWMPWEGVIIE